MTGGVGGDGGPTNPCNVVSVQEMVPGDPGRDTLAETGPGRLYGPTRCSRPDHLQGLLRPEAGQGHHEAAHLQLGGDQPAHLPPG